MCHGMAHFINEIDEKDFAPIWGRNFVYYSYEGLLFFGVFWRQDPTKTHPPPTTNTNHKQKTTNLPQNLSFTGKARHCVEMNIGRIGLQSGTQRS